MKKIMVVVFAMIVLAVPAAAYTTFVNLKINSIQCNTCSIQGITSTGSLWIDTASGCTSTAAAQLGLKPVGGFNTGSSIATNSVTLNPGGAYYACLRTNAATISVNQIHCTDRSRTAGTVGITIAGTCTTFDNAQVSAVSTGTSLTWSFGFLA